jgi:hypothetical protein
MMGYNSRRRQSGERVREMIIEFKERELREKILADRYNPLVFRKARGYPLYLVGGYLRDMLRGGRNPDRDYVAGGDYQSLLHQVVDATGGKLVRLGGYLGRIVLKDNSTLDFSPLVNSIADDLSRRDFTVNSIAWSPNTGLVDPHGGLEDLRQETIRMISRGNIELDPIRILRAYRLAGELSFKIDRNTRKVINELSPKIIEAKSERITLEFFKILNLEDAVKILAMMAHDGAVRDLFPLAAEELRHKLRVLSSVKRIFNALPLKYKQILCQRCPQNLSCLGMIRLEVLLEGVSAKALTLSSMIVRKLRMIERAKELLPEQKWSLDGIFEAFSLMGDTSIDFLMLKGRTAFLSEYERYSMIMKNGLLPTKEIFSSNALLRGANLGKVIRKLKRAEFNHQVNSYEEAVILFHRYCDDLT